MDIEILENELLWLENIGCVILYEKDGILVKSAYDVSTDFNFFILFNANVQMRKGCYRVSDKFISNIHWIKKYSLERCYDINYIYQEKDRKKEEPLYRIVEVDYKKWKKRNERKRRKSEHAHYFYIFDENMKIGRFSTIENEIVGIYDYELDCEYRNKGIGSSVLMDICSKYDKKIFIQTWNENIAAMKCYEKAGFEKQEILYRYNV